MEFCGCRCEVEKIWKRDTVWWNEKLVGYVKEVAEEMEIKHQFIHSGAGHDAQFISYMVPATMIFDPSVKGLSQCGTLHAGGFRHAERSFKSRQRRRLRQLLKH